MSTTQRGSEGERTRSLSTVSQSSQGEDMRARALSQQQTTVGSPSKGNKKFLMNEFSTDVNEEAPPQEPVLEETATADARWLGVKRNPRNVSTSNERGEKSSVLAQGAGLGSFDELGFFIHNDMYDTTKETKSQKRLLQEQRAKDAALDIVSSIVEREIAKQTRIAMAQHQRRLARNKGSSSTSNG